MSERNPSDTDRLHDAKVAVDRDYLILGRELYVAFSTGEFKEGGFQSFDDYAVSRGVEPGRAKRLRRVFKKFSKDLGVSFEQMLKIGYERLKAIEPVINRTNRNLWLSRAGELSFPELVKKVKENKTPRRRRKEVRQDISPHKTVYAPEDASKLLATIHDDRLKPSADGSEVYDDGTVYVKKLYLIAEQKQVFDTAIENMEQRTGSTKIGYLLTSALQEYLAHEATRGLKDDKRLEYFMGVLERRYKCKLLCIKDKKVAEKLTEMLNQAEEEVEAERAD